MHPLLEKLKGGDFRSIGRSEEVAQAVLADESLFPILMSGLTSEETLVRMRSADAAEKVTSKRPQWLAPHKEYLLNEVTKIGQQEVRWHTAMMLTRLELNETERTRAASILKKWLDDKSRIVQTSALQALVDLSKQDSRSRSDTKRLLEEKIKNGPPSVRARGKKLLKEMMK